MNIFDAVILGIIQGLTEFLPISSSGHLVIGETILGLSSPGMSLEIWLHFGTWLAVVIYFRRRLRTVISGLFGVGEVADREKHRQLFIQIAIGTLPAIVVGLTLKSWIETLFDSLHLTAAMLMITGAILLSTYLIKKSGRTMNLPRAIAVGLAQAVAILPGISRSGTTISCAMWMGVEPAVAAEFSFLLAVPIIALAFAYDIMLSWSSFVSADLLIAYLVGMAVSFVFGYLAIHFLMKIIQTGKFFIFGFYCLVVGVLAFILVS